MDKWIKYFHFKFYCSYWIESLKWIDGRLNKLKKRVKLIDFVPREMLNFFTRTISKEFRFSFRFIVESFLNDRATLIWNLFILRGIFNRRKHEENFNPPIDKNIWNSAKRTYNTMNTIKEMELEQTRFILQIISLILSISFTSRAFYKFIMQ